MKLKSIKKRFVPFLLAVAVASTSTPLSVYALEESDRENEHGYHLLKTIQEYKDAYEKNIYHFKGLDDGKDGAISAKGLLPTWSLYDYLPEVLEAPDPKEVQMVNNTEPLCLDGVPTATKKEDYEESTGEGVDSCTSGSEELPAGADGEGIVGYDLTHYWGPKTFEYCTNYTWTKSETQMIDGKYESDVVAKVKADITLLGTAGLLGDAEGWYGTEWEFEGWEIEGTNKFGTDIYVYNFKLVEDIKEESKSYHTRKSQFCDYEQFFVYTGSKFSEYANKFYYLPVSRLHNLDGEEFGDDALYEKAVKDNCDSTDVWLDFENEDLQTYGFQMGRKKTGADKLNERQGKWIFKGMSVSREAAQNNTAEREATIQDHGLKDTSYEMIQYKESTLESSIMMLTCAILDNVDECLVFVDNYAKQLLRKVCESDYADYNDYLLTEDAGENVYEASRKAYTPDEKNVFLCTYAPGEDTEDGEEMEVFSPKLVKNLEGDGKYQEAHPEEYTGWEAECDCDEGSHPDAALIFDLYAPEIPYDAPNPHGIEPDDKKDLEISYSWIAKGLEEIRYWDCNIQDIMQLDFLGNVVDDTLEQTDNDYLHSGDMHDPLKAKKSMHSYEALDDSIFYHVWEDWVRKVIHDDYTVTYDNEHPTKYNGWFVKEKIDSCPLPQGALTDAHEMAVESFEMSTSDEDFWFSLYPFSSGPESEGYLLTSLEDIAKGAKKLSKKTRGELKYLRDPSLLYDEADFLAWLEGLDADTIALEILKFYQSDGRWKDFVLGDGDVGLRTIGSSGCGFTSMAMIASFYAGTTITPDEIGSMFKSYYAYNVGASHSLPSAVAKQFGFSCGGQTTGFDPIAAAEQIKAGNPVLVDFSAGKYTSGGHYSVITGVTADGNFIVNDTNSNNYKKYGNEYSASDLVANVKLSWTFGK